MGKRMTGKRLAVFNQNEFRLDGRCTELLQALKAERVKVEELEAENGRLNRAVDDGANTMFEWQEAYTALEDSLRGLAEKLIKAANEPALAPVDNKANVSTFMKATANELLALLGKENEE